MTNYQDANIPDPKEIEKDISDFLSKKYGGQVKMVSPVVLPRVDVQEAEKEASRPQEPIEFDLKPEQLIAYLDQYIIKQEQAKAILATKICTHFNRIKLRESAPETVADMVGGIKNNVLMIGPTGVGKTYMIKLIAQKIGVPFVKGDATKFSETGYVGGDVEDLVRDLVREADDDIQRAQYGIIYIDEIDKIAGARNLIGVDVSRTGVQRALLKPMEETEIDLKVPHDPVSMFQELEQFRKTGSRSKQSVNTKNILFIMSGAFNGLNDIVSKRLTSQRMGFGARLNEAKTPEALMAQVQAEDLIAYGFESEFVGRLPVRAIFERLFEADLYEILKNPNNPIILGKKLDFAAYGIDVKFDTRVLRRLAASAYHENTGARGLVSAVEQALIEFERRLPSGSLKQFPVTEETLADPQAFWEIARQPSAKKTIQSRFQALTQAEQNDIRAYLEANKANLSGKYNLTLTPTRIAVVASLYARCIMDIDHIIEEVKRRFDEIKDMELRFYRTHDINIVLEDDAVDHLIQSVFDTDSALEALNQKLVDSFELGLKLIREKTGRNRFFITRKALEDPEAYLDELVKTELQNIPEPL